MSLSQLRNVSFGSKRANQTGSLGVGYTIFDSAGVVVSPRTTAGVYQLLTGSGLYAAYALFPDNFNGQIVWDCPSFTGSSGLILSQSFAPEQFNVQENDPKVALTYNIALQLSGTTAQLYDIQYGRWQIVNNQMLFYKDDNATVIASFNLFDDHGVPTMDAVFDRQKI